MSSISISTNNDNMTNEENVVVAVRIRPPLEREINRKTGYNSCIGLQKKDVFVMKKDVPVLIDETGKLLSSQDPSALERFRFDHSFGSDINTATVYKTICKDTIPSILDGKNQTIFAYGQTGSGKTFTMFKDKYSMVNMFIKDLFKEKKIEEINVSYMQIYNKVISDLIKPNNKFSLKVRESIDLLGETYVEGLTIIPIKTERELVKLLEKGALNRKTVGTKLNSASSRSHAILTFYIESKKYNTFSKVNIVDLAGSERVKDSGVTGNDLKDATNINSSLLSLARVVRSINDKKSTYIPYRDDPLCMVLKDALGGSCKTTLMATVSPSAIHCQETVSTLRFSKACSHVRNHVKQNNPRNSIKSIWAKKAKNVTGKETKKKKIYPWKNLNIENQGGRIYIDTSFGKISALAYGNPSNPLVICLHGSPSDAEFRYGNFLLASLVHSDFYAVALDAPGCGYSQGKELKCRSEYVLKDRQAGDFVDEIRKKLGAKKYSIVGYDWGAGIALAMATSKKYNSEIKDIVIFHPPMMNTYLKDENIIKRNVKSKAMIIFSKSDNMHPWNKWKSSAKKMKTALGKKKYHEYVFKGMNGWNTLEIEAKIITFLTGVDPTNGPEEVFIRPVEQIMDTNGANVNQHNNIVFKAKAMEGGYNNRIFEKENPSKNAVKEFLNLVEKGGNKTFDSMHNKLKRNDKEINLLLAKMPIIDENTLKNDPGFLIKYGVWDKNSLKGLATMQTAARYTLGREVFIDVRTSKKNHYYYETCKGKITKIGKENIEVMLDEEETCSIINKLQVVSRQDLCEYNHPQIFPKGNNGKLLFEDGLWCSYARSFAKLKTWELAWKLKRIAKTVDFENCDKTKIQNLQEKVIEIIFDNVDITTFQRNANDELTKDGEHTRARNRYCGDDIGKFACGGQGHCHTVSSTMAAMLLPWCEIFGIDLKYRETVSKSHQWLEVTYRPSNKTVIVDLMKEDTHRTGRYINQDINEADYTPSLRLNKFSEKQVRIQEIKETDFEEEEGN